MDGADPVGVALTTGAEVVAEGGEGQRVATGTQAQLEPAAAEDVDDRGVLGDPDRVLQRQDHDGGAETNALGALGGGREKGERRGETGAVVQEVVLGHPAAVVAELLGSREQVEREAIGVGSVVPNMQMGQEAKAQPLPSRAGWWRRLPRSRL